jgi:hypothetical protein
MRIIPQAREDVGQLGRQDFACIHRDQLSDFHRRSAHSRKFVGQAGKVSGRHQQIAQVRSPAATELARGTKGRRSGHSCRHGAETRQAVDSTGRHTDGA